MIQQVVFLYLGIYKRSPAFEREQEEVQGRVWGTEREVGSDLNVGWMTGLRYFCL